MTTAAEVVTQAISASAADPHAHAHAIAQAQGELRRAPGRSTHLVERHFVRPLEEARKHLQASSDGDVALSKAAEWFLDNYYLIRRSARQVADELPLGFVRRLPQLASGVAKGRMRLDVFSRALVEASDMVLDLTFLTAYVEAYQEVAPLTIAELWALPNILRATVLQSLLQFLGRLDVPGLGDDDAGSRRGGPSELVLPTEHGALEPGLGVERSVRTLRLLDALDWKCFFERTNRVEVILRTDPSGVYSLMDFETCDSYRKVVETVAWGTGHAEHDVAEAAVSLARSAGGDARRGHVGYYLVAEGRSALEERFGYHPAGLERIRRVATSHPTAAYLWPLALLTGVPLLALAASVERVVGLGDANLVWVALAAMVALVPASVVSLAVIQGVYARLLAPRTLPKLDFTKGLAGKTRTLVVMPTLLGHADDVTAMLRHIELHYLSNPDPQLQFALLTDGVDTRTPQETPSRLPLLERASQGILALNDKHGKGGIGPFHLLHRSPRWNPAEQRFMGWERKRGKLDELNRLLRGDTTTSYTLHVGQEAGLSRIRFVITLDSDTELPMGSAHSLVGALAHPLNRAVFDADTGRVTAGYTIVQPRIDASPSSPRGTLFSRMFGGRIGIDIYAHACSELYQDLFGSGIYVGKGIYDVDAFARSLEGCAPENTLVSHDLFEGVHGRTALATDVALFESYPGDYVTYSRRMQRWLRGDWQLCPWLLSQVPSARGKRIHNRLTGIDRWKIADNLRRSVSSPLLVALFVLGWLWLPGQALSWTLGTLLLLLAPLLMATVGRRRPRPEDLGRCALAIVFLAHEASVVVGAIATVWIRKKITRKHLLQWTSAAHTASDVASKSSRALYWRTMVPSPLLALAVGALLAVTRPSALMVATPILLAWFFAAEVALRISRHPAAPDGRMSDDERRGLRTLARRTWHFFQTFAGADDQWLPVDNYQESPHEKTAHRTSPTNIGLGLVATLSAYDLGYVGPTELSARVRRTLASVGRMDHYQGHLFNWYDTQTLQPLLPRYVSTVDSGNLAGCLVALEHGCREIAGAPVVRAETWDGIRDAIDVLEDAARAIPDEAGASMRSVLARMQRATDHARGEVHNGYATLAVLCDETSAELERELLQFLQTGAQRHEADALRALRSSMGALAQQLQQMRRELDALAPWLGLAQDTVAQELELPADLRLGDTPRACVRFRALLDAKESERRQRGVHSPELDASAERLREAFRTAERNSTRLVAELLSVAAQAHQEAAGMDFKLLYDTERRLLRVGYNASGDQADEAHYDLLASEARLASFIAIVKRDVPESHWYALGRPMTRVAGHLTLLSWGGTMFEYLMSGLLMSSQDGTLLARTSILAVDAQMAYAAKGAQPWGTSESAYARRDASNAYQYRSFGVPALGLKRDLEDDHVVTPYASLLALSIRPRAVVDNVHALHAKGMLGTYGMFEALDFTPERATEHPARGRPFTIVRSYMAHHQGMILVALGNFLSKSSMVDRFHRDPLIETGEALLNECAPVASPTESLLPKRPRTPGSSVRTGTPTAPAAWSSAGQPGPHAFVLGNGRLTSLITGLGGGGLRWRGLDLTRYEPDATLDEEGIWFFLRDEESREVWRATSADGRTTYAMDKVEFHLRHSGISTRIDVAVAAADDVELRVITLHNETDRPRRLTVTSAGRPVLFDAKQAPTHPVFSSMFVESERIAELDALVFARRPQSPAEEPAVLVHGLVRQGAAVTFGGYETDRGAFLGRGADSQVPDPLVTEREGLHGRVGAVLDPVMSLMARVELEPGGSVRLAFVTTVARSRADAVALARKYGSMHAVTWALRDAAHESQRRLARTNVDPALLPTIQRLFSALLFADPSLRVSPADRAAAPPSQHRLWGRGISGDQPIVLVRVSDPNAKLLDEILTAQRYLRSCGVPLDLVLVHEDPSTYGSKAQDELRSALRRNGADEWLDRHGGVFVVAADQVEESELRHLEACARILLDTRDGSLASRLAQVAGGQTTWPQWAPTLAEDTAGGPRPRAQLVFDNGIGGFTEDGREYVIDVAPGKSTPAPWCNVLANPGFGCLVSESSLGVTWSLNSGENRLTPWSNDPVRDTPSEALYLRDDETAAVWSPTPLPAGRVEQTTVRHGAGYTTYERDSHGLHQDMTVFVPHDASLKVVRLRLKNTLPRHRRLTATYYAEWVLGSRRKKQVPYIVSEFTDDCLLATCEWIAEFAGRVAFLASETPSCGHTANRTEFLGRRGDPANPEGLARRELSCRVDQGADPCAALQIQIALAPGEELETHFVLGQAGSRREALELVGRYRDPRVVDAAWTSLNAYWDGVLGNIRVKTPEPSMDLMLNRWLLYQTLSSRVMGRTGFYQSSGAFGFRDQLQDVMALLHAAPEIARAHLLDAARRQFAEGDVLHWWHPPSGRGVRTRCSDDMAWLPYVTAEYVAATGDAGVLDEQVPFLDGAPLKRDEHSRYATYEASKTQASLFEHCRRAIERAATAGVHGLPLMGDGDWNDGMSRVGSEGRGESVWLGWFLCATMDRFGALSTRRRDGAGAAHWRSRADVLRARIMAAAWDGAWYLRAFHDDGSLVGSATSRECRIDSISQSWAVLSRREGGVQDARARAVVRVVDEQLVRVADRLVLLFWPPFDVTPHDPGYIRAYPPGVRENGGQYTHAATWLGFAHAALGDGERAERTFRLLNPVLHATTREDAARYRVEPYALAGDVYSAPPWIGRGGWTWYTGSAAWMWRLGVEQILGLRKEDGDLRIDPCIPPAWEGFEAWVHVAQHCVHIVVDNAEHVGSGVKAMTLDGEAIATTRIVLTGRAPGTHEVHVRLGCREDESSRGVMFAAPPGVPRPSSEQYERKGVPS
jgi:cyclic beta-1,2-glucan synthetase